MNERNLKPNSARTPKEREELARKAGIASGEARRERKKLREALEELLAAPVDVDGEEMTGCEAVAAAMMRKALAGDVRAFTEIRDTVGEMPVAKSAVAIEKPDPALYAEIDRLLGIGDDEEEGEE